MGTILRCYDLCVTTLQQAQTAITGAGLIPFPVSYAYSASVPNGSIVSQSPAAGAMVALNVPVALVVSMGPAPVVARAVVPNVVGLSLTAASAALVAAGCGVGALSWMQGSGAIGAVTAQGVSAGSSVALGTTVALTFTSGPVVSYPELVGNVTVPA